MVTPSKKKTFNSPRRHNNFNLYTLNSMTSKDTKQKTVQRKMKTKHTVGNINLLSQ